jgi:hypothetical protein
MGWRVCGLAALAALLGLSLGEAGAGDYQTVSCSGFAIKYDGQSDKRDCYEGDLSPGKAEELVAYSPTFILEVAYYASGFRHYYLEQPLDKFVSGNELFGSPGKLQAGPAVGGYSVAVFLTDFGKTKIPSVCAVFARFYGEPGKSGGEVARLEFPSGPGYKYMIHGYYCSAGKKGMTVEDFYNDVQRILPQVHTPS